MGAAGAARLRRSRMSVGAGQRQPPEPIESARAPVNAARVCYNNSRRLLSSRFFVSN
jgi:hypothetical protein